MNLSLELLRTFKPSRVLLTREGVAAARGATALFVPLVVPGLAAVLGSRETAALELSPAGWRLLEAAARGQEAPFPALRPSVPLGALFPVEPVTCKFTAPVELFTALRGALFVSLSGSVLDLSAPGGSVYFADGGLGAASLQAQYFYPGLGAVCPPLAFAGRLLHPFLSYWPRPVEVLTGSTALEFRRLAGRSEKARGVYRLRLPATAPGFLELPPLPVCGSFTTDSESLLRVLDLPLRGSQEARLLLALGAGPSGLHLTFCRADGSPLLAPRALPGVVTTPCPDFVFDGAVLLHWLGRWAGLQLQSFPAQSLTVTVRAAPGRAGAIEFAFAEAGVLTLPGFFAGA